MLAYVFWHRPLEDSDNSAVEAYEHADLAFHRSLAHVPPAGFQGSAVFRVDELPWLDGPGYEDWYFVEDYTALGVLNEAAVGHGHRTAHDGVAHRFGAGAGGLYCLIEGRPPLGAGRGVKYFGEESAAVWVARAAGIERRGLGEMLGDGMDAQHASLWRRQLVFGPAPEFCLLAGDRAKLGLSAGVAPSRLPVGWTASMFEREALWAG
ncbi:MAG: hypothetical protein ACRDK7_02585 [Solirubrobacteraceae bacterium]